MWYGVYVAGESEPSVIVRDTPILRGRVLAAHFAGMIPGRVPADVREVSDLTKASVPTPEAPLGPANVQEPRGRRGRPAGAFTKPALRARVQALLARGMGRAEIMRVTGASWGMVRSVECGGYAEMKRSSEDRGGGSGTRGGSAGRAGTYLTVHTVAGHAIGDD